MTRTIDVFISSKIGELKPERDMLLSLLPTLLEGLVKFRPWVYEHNAVASVDPPPQTYLDALNKSALYIGLFWNEYGPGTIDEFEHAKEWRIDRLIFVKDIDRNKRDSQLIKFLNQNNDELTDNWFRTEDELQRVVTRALEQWVFHRLYKEPEHRKRLYHLETHRHLLYKALREYTAYLVDHPTPATKDEKRHQSIISDAFNTCLAIDDSADVQCTECLGIEAEQDGYEKCSHKYEKNLAYIMMKRLTPNCVVGNEGKREQAEARRWLVWEQKSKRFN